MNSLSIHVAPNDFKLTVNGTVIDNVKSYEVKQTADHWDASVKLEFDVDGPVDIDINQ